MLGSARIVAFAPTTDPKRAKAFFSDTLGLKLVSEDPYALVYDAHGTPLRVATVQQLTPAPYTIVGWLVPDIAATVRGLRERGVAFQRFPGMTQDADGVWTAPGGGKVAWFKDPDSNTLSVTQMP
jgi:catechol 2,3-dioxygenase-like lactoylglutathione lyase family enzyme